MSTPPPLSSALPFQQLSYPKPKTPWDVLDFVEPQSQKICRCFGQLFVGVALAAAAVRYVAPRRLSFTLAMVAVGSLVSGAVLWFFNRSNSAPQGLLKDRKQVGAQIETCALSKLREPFITQPLVFSNEELNEWIRYFAGKDSFETFMKNQTESVFSLPLEPETRWFLTCKVIEYFEQAVQITFKAFRAHPFYSILRPDGSKCLKLYKVIANREAAKLVNINADSYTQFIQEQGVEVLNHLNKEQLQRLQPGFADQVLRSEIGIIDLKANYAGELSAFGDDARTFLLQAIATREVAQQSYSTFVQRNGPYEIGTVTDIAAAERLLQNFVSYVVSQNLGLVQTRYSFGLETIWFISRAWERIESEVLDREMAALTSGTMTYKQFGERNGFELIRYRTPTERELFRPYFLKLPYADLVGPQYRRDRELLNINRKDIQDTLRARWSGMTLKEVLATNPEGFLASMKGESPYFTPREWTAQAVREIQSLPVKDVITTYGALFQAKVLTASDGDLANRFAQGTQHISNWEGLIDAYGPFVIEHQLIDATKLELLVGDFIRAHAMSFFIETYEQGIVPYVKVINDFNLSSRWTILFRDKRAERAEVIKKSTEWSQDLAARCDQIIKSFEEGAASEIAHYETITDLSAKQSKKEKAHEKCIQIQASYVALGADIRLNGQRNLLTQLRAAAQANKEEAEKEFNTASSTLAEKKAKIQETCARNIEAQQLSKAEALEGEERRKNEILKTIFNSFQASI